eukprot:TRINITY_DN9500_c0_g1_i1.p1 TRINITY_DN9500_c0_g1~~TRINITY_DN9500_c0_g1_i1.p1  ORF type:complete len:469 (+),score=51.88 TRINITY_DN9500_c0_g1_i1:783-2189(+)
MLLRMWFHYLWTSWSSPLTKSMTRSDFWRALSRVKASYVLTCVRRRTFYRSLSCASCIMQQGRMAFYFLVVFSACLEVSKAIKQVRRQNYEDDDAGDNKATMKWLYVDRVKSDTKIMWQLRYEDGTPYEHFKARYFPASKFGKLQVSTRSHAGTFARPRRLPERKLIYSIAGGYLPNEEEDVEIEVNMVPKAAGPSGATNSEVDMLIQKTNGTYTVPVRMLGSSGDWTSHTLYNLAQKKDSLKFTIDKMFGKVFTQSKAWVQKSADADNQWWIALQGAAFDSDAAELQTPEHLRVIDGVLGPLTVLFSFVVAEDWLHELQNQGPCSKYQDFCFNSGQFDPGRCAQTESTHRVGLFLGQFCWTKRNQACAKKGPDCEYDKGGHKNACHKKVCSYDGPCRDHKDLCLTGREFDETKCKHYETGPLQQECVLTTGQPCDSTGQGLKCEPFDAKYATVKCVEGKCQSNWHRS